MYNLGPPLMTRLRPLLLLLCGFCLPASAQTLLLKGATLYDGTGRKPYRADVRVSGEKIVAVGKNLKAAPGEEVRNVRGLALAPGFIDMHSHADRGLLDNPTADTVIRQGVTTVLVGQDGGSMFPLADWFSKLEANPPSLNVASMAGHATLRRQVMGEDLYRQSTAAELQSMKAILESELLAGAFGLSTGLEYEAGHFASTDEVVELSKVAARAGGFYISHVRDEGNGVFDAFQELITIGERARLPVEITHIKLGSTRTWGQAAPRMPKLFADARKRKVDLRADVYPYTYWQSTLRVIVLDRDFFNPEKVKQAIADNGGAEGLRITRYGPDPAMAGKTLAEFATAWQLTPTEAYMRIIRETTPTPEGKDGREEGVIGTSMSEEDVRWFIAQPQIAFCSDGALNDHHPRGAGAFPRVLGKYVREEKVLPLESAIHKMTGLPAERLALRDRGRIAPGYQADLVVFDPARVVDRSTIENPTAPPDGIPGVMVAGKWVVDGGKVTGARPGKVLRHRIPPRLEQSGR